MSTTPLTHHLISQAVQLDRQWFGDKGVSAEDLSTLISRFPDSALCIKEGDTLLGFATFEILDDRLPTDFVGTFSHTESVLFIYQFTTRTNYARADWSVSRRMLQRTECVVVRKVLE